MQNVCVAVTDPDARLADGATDGVPVVPWTLVQTKGTGSLNGNDTRTLANLAATGAGNTIIVAIETDDEPIEEVRDNAGNTYTRVPGSRAVNLVEAFGIEVWVANDVAAGATSITATTGAADDIYAVVAWEVAGLAKTDLIDTVATIDNAAATSTPAGAEATTTADGEFVVSIAIVGNTVNGLAGNSDFTNDQLTLGNGWAHLTSTTAPAGNYTARWNQNGSFRYCATSVAFRRAN